MGYPGFTAEAVYSKIARQIAPTTLLGEDGAILLDDINHIKRIWLQPRKGEPEELGYREKLPNNMDHPTLEAAFVENYEPTSAFGTKALGEPPACSGAPAIRNAIYQATGVAIDQIPITPHVLFARFEEAGLIQE